MKWWQEKLLQEGKQLEETGLSKYLGNLNYRARRILELRFGLKDEEPLSLKDTGRRFGLSKERVRQIQQEGLKKLRATKRFQRNLLFCQFQDEGMGIGNEEPYL